MTDVSSPGTPARPDRPLPAAPGAGRPGEADLSSTSGRDELVACVELLFFAYRDFTGDPDAVLEEYGFGRAHHRVLHFVARNPGLTVAELLDILRITKQSLARVLKQLVSEGFVMQRAGAVDRRERRLYLTAKGTRLAEKLTSLQIKRIEAALQAAGPDAGSATRRFLFAMIADQYRPQVEALIRATGAAVARPADGDGP